MYFVISKAKLLIEHEKTAVVDFYHYQAFYDKYFIFSQYAIKLFFGWVSLIELNIDEFF